MNTALIRYIDKTQPKTKKDIRERRTLSPADQHILDSITPGIEVDHGHFGIGTVVEITDDIISVDFDSTIRKFPYPGSVLEMYLTLI